MNFRVGQKVVCVDDEPPRFPKDTPDHLVLNAIYTVIGIDPENGTGVYLKETRHLVPRGSRSPRGWAPRRFRPVVERKTDISIFTKMLTDTRVPADAR